ncbi:hypothetical protein BT96DRAFT_1051635, partial [Gymnopus androsaceus JB14]
WINSQEPLSVEESKVLYRSLESLNTKPVIKKLSTSTTAPPKVESLAKPFSEPRCICSQSLCGTFEQSVVCSASVSSQGVAAGTLCVFWNAERL